MYLKKINKDKIRRDLSSLFEIRLKALKYLIKYLNIHSDILLLYSIYNSINKDFFFTRVNNLCILTGRQSGVYKVCKISRIELRNSEHDIYGLRKSSW